MLIEIPKTLLSSHVTGKDLNLLTNTINIVFTNGLKYLNNKAIFLKNKMNLLKFGALNTVMSKTYSTNENET